ncbi:hypothetical protein HHI36_010010 [Cryptolaemus montrouzieri]|uniref:Amino acid transporter transmembrane domain-containing protein n=1 Tax=Cryptolaemus montrouzieri TaxID=559131 RepID=A0ABD2MHG9_9CUCU
MPQQKDKYPSTFSVDDFNSTTVLTKNAIQKEKESKGDEYNPYEHRHLEHPNTFAGALIHLLKTSLGTGILAVPSAFKSVGFGFGLIGTILIGALCTHTVTLLVSASQKMCRQTQVPQLSFAQTVESVFKHGPDAVKGWSTFARIFVEIGLILTYLLSDTVYSVFVATSLSEIVNANFSEAKQYGIDYYLLGQMILLLLLCQIRPLKFLVPFSTIANCSMFVAFAITFFYMFRDAEEVSVSTREAFNFEIMGIAHFVSTIVFAMEGIGAIMPLENSMVEEGFLGCPGVLYIAMSTIITLYASIGFVGYYAYGPGTKPSIISNLTADDWASQVARGCIALSIFFTFMLQFYVPMEITWRNLKPHIPKKTRNITQILIRIVGVIFAIGVAILIPDLTTLISLVGAVFFSTLGLFVPAAVDIIIRWDSDLGAHNWILIKNILICIFSVIALVCGSYFAIDEMINPPHPSL